jgi:spore germination protein YaaH
MKRFSLACLLFVACGQQRTDPEDPGGYQGTTVTPEDVAWTQLVNATASANSITKSGGQPWAADAGGVSAQSLGAGDGWLEISVDETQAFRFAGLSRAHAGTSGDAIEFAFRLQAGRADIYESGAWKADNTVVAGDTLRITVQSSIVTYSKNGAALYTSAATPQYPLLATAALIDGGSTVSGARLLTKMPPASGTFVSGVTAQPSSDGTSAVVSWTSNVPTDGQVQYGPSASYGTWSVYGATVATTHAVTLTGLTSGATYHYRVRSQDSAGNAVYSADATFATPGGSTSTGPAHHFCGWLQATGYVALEQDPGYLAFVAHAADYDAVHPMWYYLSSSTTFKAAYGEGSSMVLMNTTAGGKRTLLIPTIAAADGSQPQWASTMLHDATLEAQHIAAIMNLVTTKGYDGIDLDYEHLSSTDRDAFSAFAETLAAQLHAKGKTLSFAVNGMTTHTYAQLDYDRLSAAADQLHVMGYDFHYLGSHPGPVTPLGWIQQVAANIKTVAGGARTGKFILGLPNYGLAGSDSGTTTWFGSSMDCINLVGGVYDTTTTHMSVCPLTNGTSMAAGRAPNAMSSKGHLYFDDLLSLEEKVQVAKNAGLGGITYWTIGGEPDRPGTRTFWQMIRAYYPQ